MTTEDFQEKILPTIPGEAGIYKFIGENQMLLYVGKAKNLKKRVISYFTKSNQLNNRLLIMVRKSVAIEFTVVESEHDALLLENSLIKKHQPKYNIQLKDSKTYPFICIKKERFPRVFLTRNRVKDGSEYLGPYTSVNRVKTILEFICSTYHLRTCNFNLSPSNIEKRKFRVCLEYHIGNCLGPCEGLQDEADYMKAIGEIKDILKGNTRVVIQHLKKQMAVHAESFEFEKAEEVKKKLFNLEKYQSRSTIVSPIIDNVDVCSIVQEGKYAFSAFFRVINGTIIQTHAVQLVDKTGESPENLLLYAIVDLRSKFGSSSKEIILPFRVDYPDDQLKQTIPVRGDKKKLLELAEKNALQFKNQTLTRLDKFKTKKGPKRVLVQLKNDFNLNELPGHIECFDNSNLQGTNPVASMVCFINGKAAKSEYRHYNIKTVVGPDDYGSMEEVVYRRYKRLLMEEKSLPQLIIIDGGKGQLNAAYKSLQKLGLEHKISVAAIAKRLEEIYFPGDPVPRYVNKKSESLKLLQQLRNEAHRFAINFHRQKRSKEAIHSELEDIKGVGKKTTEKLLTHFKSVRKVREADEQELIEIAGKKAANLIKIYFRSE